MGELLVEHIPSKENVTDLMTKVLNGLKKRYLVNNPNHDYHWLSVSDSKGCNNVSLIPLKVSSLRGLESCRIVSQGVCVRTMRGNKMVCMIHTYARINIYR